MRVKVNGKERAVDNDAALDKLILESGIDAKGIVVEHNLNIIPREGWSGVTLKDGDTVEMIKFVGGG